MVRIEQRTEQRAGLSLVQLKAKREFTRFSHCRHIPALGWAQVTLQLQAGRGWLGATTEHTQALLTNSDPDFLIYIEDFEITDITRLGVGRGKPGS